MCVSVHIDIFLRIISDYCMPEKSKIGMKYLRFHIDFDKQK